MATGWRSHLEQAACLDCIRNHNTVPDTGKAEPCFWGRCVSSYLDPVGSLMTVTLARNPSAYILFLEGDMLPASTSLPLPVCSRAKPHILITLSFSTNTAGVPSRLLPVHLKTPPSLPPWKGHQQFQAV